MAPNGGGMMQNQITPLQLVPQPPPSLLEAILITGGLGLLAYGLLSALSPDEPKRTCGACGRPGHNRTTCPHDGPRITFSRAIPRSPQRQCCGQYRYGTSRHHPRAVQIFRTTSMSASIATRSAATKEIFGTSRSNLEFAAFSTALPGGA